MENADKLLGKDGAFASRLRELYNAAEPPLTLEEVGSAIGVTRQTFSKYLEGKAKPTIENIFNLANYFHVSSDYLLGLRNEKSKDLDVQIIHDKTGLSEEVIRSLQREIKMIQRLTNRENVDEALSEFTALREINFNISASPRGEFAEYLEDHGFAGINEILDNELNITPTELIKFLPDALVCNELMRGAISKYTNKNLNAVMIALYGVLSHRPKKTVYQFYDKNYQYEDTDFEEHELTDDEFFECCDKIDKHIAEYGTEPLYDEEASGALERDELEDDDVFAVKAFKLQQALTKRLEYIKNSKK